MSNDKDKDKEPPIYPPPSLEFFVRPHHISLLAILVLAFKEFDAKRYHPGFLLQLYRMLLEEVSEVNPHSSVSTIKNRVQSLPVDEDDLDAQNLVDDFLYFNINTCEELISFFTSVPLLFTDKNDEDETVFTRRSIFGFFCRRNCLAFSKLSFSGIIKLFEDFSLWWEEIDPRAGYQRVPKDEMNNPNLQILRTKGDRIEWAQHDTYETFLKAQTVGDDNLSKETLRAAFEQRFHEEHDSGIRQYALLNLLRMHYVNNEYEAARQLLNEAVDVSRTYLDKLTLQQCISILHRFPAKDPSADKDKRPPLNEIQPHLNPLDILYDVRKLIEEGHEQPMSLSFIKITEAIGVFDYWFDHKMETTTEADQYAQHAVQSVVWSIVGSEDLARIESEIVMAFTPPEGPDNNRLTTILNQAYQRARQGNYEAAIAMLLQPSVWKGISVADYGLWAQGVWQILALRASRSGQDHFYRDYLLPRRPPGDFNPRLYSHRESLPPRAKKGIANQLYEVIQMRQCDQSIVAVEPLLSALWHSEFLFRINFYRTGILFLADIGLHFGMTKRSQRMVEDLMPQLISGNDIEQRALAAFILARCIIMAEGLDASALQSAAEWLSLSEKDFLSLEMYRSAIGVQYLLSVVYDNMGLNAARDEAAKRHLETQEQLKRLEVRVIDHNTESVLETVSRIGMWLACRRSILPSRIPSTQFVRTSRSEVVIRLTGLFKSIPVLSPFPMGPAPKLTKKQKKAIAFRERKSKGTAGTSSKDVDQDGMGGNEVPEMEIQESGDDEVVQVGTEEVEGRKEKRGDKDRKDKGKDKDAEAGAQGNVQDKGKGKTKAEDRDGDTKISAGKKRKREDRDGEEERIDGDVENIEGQEKIEKSWKKKRTGDDKPRYILFVGNLKYTTSIESIQSHFSACEPPPNVRLLTPKASSTNSKPTVSKSKGCAFLEFTHPHALQQALKLHHSQLDGRSINVELTAGGGGKSEARMNKVKERNKKLFGERKDKPAKKKKEGSGASRPERYSATSGVDQKPETNHTWTVGDVQEDKTHRGGKKHARPSKKPKTKDWGTGVNAIPVG
ncbi:hypothetical protein K435DRAFT_959687 [Dendrothele bispora CBS 962.96]|uniref:Anaphase-promoting complex subunit 5 n=1 Tax=Dendrothele bispora (strain CBS 962.96) TaxID=1314807 RepID=A0A4V4HIS9_DENBC|nr:hypothetical protein K435DRAFT_959687 [Dendrothele bispora CBS 962.96]